MKKITVYTIAWVIAATCCIAYFFKLDNNYQDIPGTVIAKSDDLNLGIRVGFLSDDGFISAFWYDEQDCYETISKLHCESNRDFYRSHLDNTEPEFWTYFPEFVNPLNNRR